MHVAELERAVLSHQDATVQAQKEISRLQSQVAAEREVQEARAAEHGNLQRQALQSESAELARLMAEMEEQRASHDQALQQLVSGHEAATRQHSDALHQMTEEHAAAVEQAGHSAEHHVVAQKHTMMMQQQAEEHSIEVQSMAAQHKLQLQMA